MYVAHITGYRLVLPREKSAPHLWISEVYAVGISSDGRSEKLRLGINLHLYMISLLDSIVEIFVNPMVHCVNTVTP